MKRYPAFDPPEYQNWVADPELVEGFAARLRDDPERQAHVEAMSPDALLGLYRDLLLTRLQDIGLKRWVKQGVISKAWLGVGEEATTVGAVAALDAARDVVSPMIRNAGACHMMGMPLEATFRGYLATEDSPNGGRDLHIGDPAKGVIQPISHMGTSVCIVAGAALAFKQRGEGRVALTWVGDGATKTAACHEGFVLARELSAPAIFVVQNNQVALGTRIEQHGAGRLEAWPDAYGMEAFAADGNNVLDVYAATSLARVRCLEGAGPVMILAETFRMGGHATHDEREAREAFPPEWFKEWGKRDPVGMFEAYLTGRGFAGEELAAIEKEATDLVEAAADLAKESRDRLPDPRHAIYDGYALDGVLEPLRARLGASQP
ncbi:MAG: thiamine pyrophosphate-dependent dehydrogenase E1 component subunit alpha [Gemmatimonadetes bacterium]|nr:thiamine pyrophosphate-dependent dehydrogenase E1 component subunit alpha [Gemmatimonadota bacterium]